MTINRSQLKFHETFQPETSYLARILELAEANTAGDKYSISERTGIPTGKQKGKVEPHIKYASYMGLIDYVFNKGIYTLSLTQLGKEVFVQDKYLHENLTHWICHYGISRRSCGAPQWMYIVRNGHSGFYQSNSTEHHLKKANALFGTNVDAEELFGVVKRSYTDGFFEDINYLRWDAGVNYIEHAESPELLFLYAYVILDSWDQLFPTKVEISLPDLVDSIEFGKIFNLSHDEIDSVLNSLELEGILKVNRQLFPLTIVRTVRIEDIIPDLYSRLI